ETSAGDDHDERAAATTAARAADIAGGIPDDVQVIVDALDDKRAADIAVLDLRSVSDTLDWFVVATGESSLQLKALEDSVRERIKAHGHLPRGVEVPSLLWVLLDYGVAVVLVLLPLAQSFYHLDAPQADTV